MDRPSPTAATAPAGCDRAHLVRTLVEGTRALLEDQGKAAPAEVDETTRLVGHDAVLSSLELVSLIVEMEQAVDEHCGVAVTIADERAMSRSRSPFRTIGTLADYVLELIRGA